MVTIKAMADKIGVSPTTISNVIHGNTKEVSAETIDKVQLIIKESNYIPNMSARTLAQKCSKIIGVVMKYPKTRGRNAVQDPFNGEVLGALETSISAMGYYMMMYSTDNIEDILKLTATWNVDGLILLGIHAVECQDIKRQTTKPIVFIDCYFYNDEIDYVNVGLEDKESAYEMTQYIISQGHKRIAFLADNRVGVDEERWGGYYQALKDNGIHSNETDFIYLGADEESLKLSLEQVLLRITDFTALFFASDYYATKAINFFTDHHVNVPDVISIVGFDDNILGRNMRPRLTTIRQNPTLKGTLAVEQLLKLIREEPLEKSNIRLPAQVMIRDTVKNLNN